MRQSNVNKYEKKRLRKKKSKMFRKNSFFQLFISSTSQRRFMSSEQRLQFKNTNKRKIFAGKSKYALLVTFAPNFIECS